MTSNPRCCRKRRAVLMVLTVSVVLLGACSTSRFKGRVIEGSIGRATAVDPTDARLLEPGVSDVSVQLIAYNTARGGAARRVIAQGISDADGEFTLRVPLKDYSTERVLVRAEGAGIFVTQNELYMPYETQRLLVLVRKSPGATVGGGDG